MWRTTTTGKESDNTYPIVDRDEDVRRRFAELWSIRTSGDASALALDAAWQPIANLLDGHTGVEAAVAHRILLNLGSTTAVFAGGSERFGVGVLKGA